MKKLILTVSILVVNIIYSQENSSIQELNPPLNFYQCNFCINQNPIIHFENIPNITNKCEKLHKIIGDSYIPVKLQLDNKGVLKFIEVFYQVNPIEEKIINNPNIIQFLNELLNYKVANFEKAPKSDVIGKIMLKLTANQLTILNQ